MGAGVTRCMECVLRTLVKNNASEQRTCRFLRVHVWKIKRRNAVTETWDLKNGQTLYVHAHSLVEYLDDTYMLTLTRGNQNAPPNDTIPRMN